MLARKVHFIYCQSSAGTLTRNRIIGYLAISSSYIVRDVMCMPPKSLRKTKVTWQFFLGEDVYVLHSFSKRLANKSLEKSQANQLKPYPKEYP